MTEQGKKMGKEDLSLVFTQKDKTDYLNATQKLSKLNDGVKVAYIAFGFELAKVRDRKLYALDDYKNVFEYAEDKFQMARATANNAINVAKKFCDDKGKLKEEYIHFNFTQLCEMLSLPEDVHVESHNTVKEIRELKKSLKEDKQEPKKEDKQEVASSVNGTEKEIPKQEDYTNMKERPISKDFLTQLEKVLYDKKVDTFIRQLIADLKAGNEVLIKTI